MTLYTAEKALKDNETKIPEELKNEVNNKIIALRTVKDGSDADSIKKATEELSSEMSKIGEAVSKAGGNTESANTTTTPEEQPAEVRDAEFKEGENPASREGKKE